MERNGNAGTLDCETNRRYQEHSDVRMRKMSADISNMDSASDLGLNNLERRVTEIERRILDSPVAARFGRGSVTRAW